jgi:DNA processing protein
MTTPPRAENFPRRNRIVSGMALGVLVIEAPTRSGALITARIASEEHNREVMAVPGKVDSANSGGCHKIIREGWATLVTNAAEVLDALGETGQLLKAGVTLPPDRPPDETVTTLFTQNLTPSQQRIVDALNGTASPDQLSAATGLAVSVVQADLTMLQIRGLVRKEGLRFVRQDGR